MRQIFGAFFLSVALVIPCAAFASDEKLHDGLTGDQLLNLLQERGYRATLSADSGGDPQISSATNGTKYFIYFYGCDKAIPRICKSIQLTAVWTNDLALTESDCNRFNLKFRFARFELIDSKTIALSSDAYVVGVTNTYLSGVLDGWDYSISNATTFFDKK